MTEITRSFATDKRCVMTARRTICIILSVLLLALTLPFSAVAEDIKPSEESDFTLLWVSDPQWYAFKYQNILVAQNEWVVDNYDRMNIGYIIHTGDFVDLPHNRDQWNFVDSQYKKWDDAGLRYGVLAGNHDVDGTDYTEFSEYFGKERFEDGEWYGGGYDGNRGHYDLLTLGGVDFIFVYLGYGTHSAQDYEWMNGVLKEHSDRIAFLMFHEYLNADGTRTAVGEQIFSKVVLKNPNVRAVLCGHNYNAARLVEYVDDDGDGKEDRTVYQLMANYQNTPNGGNGFMRFLECDVDGGRIIQRTYSPYLKQFNAFENRGDELDEFGFRDEFSIPFDFSKPKAKADGEPESGSVVTKPTVYIGSSALPVKYFNVFEGGNGYKSAGVYDIGYSLDARDALAHPEKAWYVTVEFADEVGWTVCGIFEGYDTRVSIPQNGRAIVISKDCDAIGPDSLKIGDSVVFSQVGATRTGNTSSVNLRIKGLYGTFAVDTVNAKAANCRWAIYDKDCESGLLKEVIADGKHLLYAFTPTENGRYSLTEAIKNEADIPEKGFILAINTKSMLGSLKASIEKVFTVGREAILYGFEPGSGFTLKGESIISKEPLDWILKSSTVVLEADGDGLVMYNTDGLWPDAKYVYNKPITVDPKSYAIYYDFYMEQGSKASFVVNLSNGSFFKLNSYFDGAIISSGSGDVKGNGGNLTGSIDLSKIEMDPKCLNSDGTVTIANLQIFVAGTAEKKMNVKELRIYAIKGEGDGIPEDFLVPEKDELHVSDVTDGDSLSDVEGLHDEVKSDGDTDYVLAVIAPAAMLIAIALAAIAVKTVKSKK